ncbi:MAG: hypothetical protein ACRDG4_10440 [Chloroflexota bacterium]
MLSGAFLVGALLLPHAGSSSGPGIAHAAAPKLVWQIAKRTFDPATKVDEIDSTFTPTANTYVIEVELESADLGDEAYVQLGASDSDATQVTTDEDRFFAAADLVKGTMPRFRFIADPKHDYGGRTLTYAIAVYAVPDLPLDVSGVAVSALPNILAFRAPGPGSYTVHYTLDSGSAHIILLDQSNHQQDSGKISGEGGYTVTLAGGLTGIGLKQTPASGTEMHWHITVGQAVTVGKLSPANNARLTTPPSTLSAVAAKGAQLVLDQKPVGGKYDPASRTVTYTPSRPLAAGEHVLQVAGADGTLAAKSSRFVVLPDLAGAPPTAPAGTFNGASWVSTTTPDGLYHFKMPASWRLLASGTKVIVYDPKNSGIVILDERFLGQSLDATSVAKQISANFKGAFTVHGKWQYQGGKDKAVFSGVVTAKGQKNPLASVNMVYPSASSYSLLLAYGYGTTTTATVTNLGEIEGSIGINTFKQIQSSRQYQHYAKDGLKMDYPVGWAADFADTGGGWFAGPQDGAVLIAVGRTYSGSGANTKEAQSFASQVQDLEKSAHPKIVWLTQSTSNAAVRWIGAYPSDDGKSIVIEIGQSLVGNGHFVGIWGDTPLEQAPANLAVLQHSMDSVAAGAGLTAPATLTVDSMIQAMRQAGGSGASATTSNGKSSSPGSADYLAGYQRLAAQNAMYTTMNNIMVMQEATNLQVEANFSDSPYSYSVSYGGY